MYSEEIKSIIQSKYMIVLELEQNFIYLLGLFFHAELPLSDCTNDQRKSRSLWPRSSTLLLSPILFCTFPYFFSTSNHVLFICFLSEGWVKISDISSFFLPFMFFCLLLNILITDRLKPLSCLIENHVSSNKSIVRFYRYKYIYITSNSLEFVASTNEKRWDLFGGTNKVSFRGFSREI